MSNTRAFIVAEITRLAYFFGINIDEMRMGIYVEELAGLTPEQVVAAVKRIKTTWKPTAANPYPAICDFLAAAGQPADGNPQLAIATLRRATNTVGQYNSVSFCDPALHYVIQAFGGWVALCGWENTQWDVNMGRMVEAYREAKRAGYDGGTHAIGITEANNGWGYIDIIQNDKRVSRRFQEKPPTEIVSELRRLCYGGGSINRIENKEGNQ
jgi:hypothetical protein